MLFKNLSQRYLRFSNHINWANELNLEDFVKQWLVDNVGLSTI